ncbi:hypothetical protein ABKV19_004628 [Rosa sericea]
MKAAAKRHGIEITSLSRPIKLPDFRDFDVILAMDKQNRADILEAFNRWKFREPLLVSKVLAFHLNTKTLPKVMCSPR